MLFQLFLNRLFEIFHLSNEQGAAAVRAASRFPHCGFSLTLSNLLYISHISKFLINGIDLTDTSLYDHVCSVGRCDRLSCLFTESFEGGSPVIRSADVELTLSRNCAEAALGRALLSRLVEDVRFNATTKAELMELAESLDLVEGARIEAMLWKAGDL